MSLINLYSIAVGSVVTVTGFGTTAESSDTPSSRYTVKDTFIASDTKDTVSPGKMR
jgi:hypothetical protein